MGELWVEEMSQGFCRGWAEAWLFLRLPCCTFQQCFREICVFLIHLTHPQRLGYGCSSGKPPPAPLSLLSFPVAVASTVSDGEQSGFKGFGPPRGDLGLSIIPAPQYLYLWSSSCAGPWTAQYTCISSLTPQNNHIDGF